MNADGRCLQIVSDCRRCSCMQSVSARRFLTDNSASRRPRRGISEQCRLDSWLVRNDCCTTPTGRATCAWRSDPSSVGFCVWSRVSTCCFVSMQRWRATRFENLYDPLPVTCETFCYKFTCNYFYIIHKMFYKFIK